MSERTPPENAVIWECSRCGEEYESFGGHNCPVDGAVSNSGRCPLCGEEYDSWLDHILGDH